MTVIPVLPAGPGASDPVALVGLACLFPDASTPDAFWRNLLDGRDSTSLLTAAELGVDPSLIYDPRQGVLDKSYWMRGGFVRDFRLDPEGFRLSADAIEQLDEVTRWTLHVVRGALRDAVLRAGTHDSAVPASGAGEIDGALRRCGLVLGNLSFPTRSSQRAYGPLYVGSVERALGELLDRPDLRLPGPAVLGEAAVSGALVAGSPAGLAARALGLGGPTFCLDAACASSLYAIALACEYLRAGKADLMLAGAVSCADPMFVNMGFSIFRAFPADGAESRPLDRRSGGLVAGEGAGIVALKRHADAVRDGDRIYALVRGAGLSNDGRGKHVLQPSSRGQVLALERAYAASGVDPRDVQYVECHATGTPAGDVVELNTIERFFGAKGHIPLTGTVKSNFGHLLTAAGVAGTIKTALAMGAGQIPATIRVDEPLASEEGAVNGAHLVRAAVAWPATGKPRMAGVSAFGFGGTNAHVVLEAPGISPSDQPAPAPENVAPAAVPPVPAAQPALAITGMAVHTAGCEDLAAFEQAVYDGRQLLGPLPEQRWRGITQHELRNGADAPPGAYLRGFDLDFLQYRIPPNPSDQPIAQQLLLLSVADAAIRDAALRESAPVAVVVAMETELELHRYRGRVELDWQVRAGLREAGIWLSEDEETALAGLAKQSVLNPAQVNQYASFIGNIMATRVASQWDFSGPAFTVSESQNASFRALEVAQLLLAGGTVEAVVVAGVELAGSVESVTLRDRVHPAGRTLGLQIGLADGGEAGWLPGDGAAAVVVRLARDAARDQERIYATVEAVSLARSDGAPRAGASPVTPAAVTGAAREALEMAGVTPREVGYLEASSSGVPAEDEAEISGLMALYRDCGGAGHEAETAGASDASGPGNAVEANEAEYACAFGSVKATVGHSFAAAGLFAVVKAALCLSGRFIPAVPGWNAPAKPELWAGGSFYFPTEARPWLTSRARPRRIAAVSGLCADGSAAHVVLAGAAPAIAEEGDHKADALSVTATGALCGGPLPYLLPVVADDLAGLLAALEVLQRELMTGQALGMLAETRCRAASAADDVEFGTGERARFALVILAHDNDGALKEVERARTGVPDAVQRGGEWITPAGSCFAARPLHGTGDIAFVYSGGISAYPGLGRDLLRAFPHLHHVLAQRVVDPALAMSDRLLYPRHMVRPMAAMESAMERRLVDDAFAVAAAGASFSLLGTTLLREVLGVHPQAAFGFSLGEASMMLALGVWPGGDLVVSAARGSAVLGPRLSGPKGAARDAWGVPARVPGDDFWQTFLVLAPAADVAAVLRHETRAFLTITATQKEVFIAGDPEACRRVIERLRCGHAPAPFNYVLHCPPVLSEMAELERLYRLPVATRPPLTFYSAVSDAPLELEPETIARSIAGVVCGHLDFPALVERAYEGGARLFVEQGPGSACSRWIRTILGDRPHMAVSLDQKGTDGRVSLLRLVARLLSHRVPVRLECLLPAGEARGAPAPARQLVERIVPGGPSIRDVIVTAEHISRFRPLAHMEAPLAAVRASGPGVIEALAGMVSREAETHMVLIVSRREAARAMAAAVRWQLDLLRGGATLPATAASPASAILATGAFSDNVIWNQRDLLEFAGGEIARVFGPEYAPIDTYRRRVKLPLAPYLLVSRVTQLKATRGEFQPSTMTTEYDVPVGAWYCVDGQVPCAVAVESGQCDLLLISYLGIDFENRGERVYRLLDCTLTFLDELPREGQTLRYDISINSFARSGEQLLFFFSYECFVGEKMVLKMDGGCAGFFTDEELEQGRGVLYTEAERAARARVERRAFQPLLTCRRRVFDEADVAALSEGDLTACFGAAYEKHGHNPALRLPPPALRMFDRVIEVERDGGAWGLGTVVAEKDLRPDDWYFPCHFQGDEVLAGSLMAEGCVQLLQFFLLYLGCHVLTTSARFQPIRGLAQVVRCRGQVTPAHSKLTYRLEVTSVGLTPEPFAVADVEIVVDGKVVVHFKNLGLRLAEDPEGHGQRLAPLVRRPAPFDERHIDAFATGRMADCFGAEFAVYDGRAVPRQPNDDLQLISRILEVQGTRLDFTPGASVLAEYDVPDRPWFAPQDGCPDTPYAILMELALQPCGFLSAWLGSTLLYPDENFHFRNLDGSGRRTTVIAPGAPAVLDLRGKTVQNRVRLVSSTAMDEVVIQKFTFEMACDGSVFFVGDASFGHFSGNALANQVGLDAGRLTAPWHETAAGAVAGAGGGPAIPLDLRGEARHLFEGRADAPHFRLAGGKLDLLDSVLVIPESGRYGRGYVFGTKIVDPTDWFYACHFYQDPVMPGSLGVQALVEALKALVIQSDLGWGLRAPRFVHPTEHTVVWKYRGQILPAHGTVTLEAHLKHIEQTPERVTVVADGSLWRDGLRIYEVTDLAIVLEETRKDGVIQGARDAAGDVG